MSAKSAGLTSTAPANLPFVRILIIVTFLCSLAAIFLLATHDVSSKRQVEWKTYKNEELGYLINYPGGWYPFTGGVLPDNTVIFTKSSDFDPQEEKDFLTEHISLIVKDLKEESPTQDLDEYIDREASGLKKGKASQQKFGNHDVKNLRREALGSEAEVEMFYLKKGQKLFRLGVYPIEANDPKLDLAREMLSSLKLKRNSHEKRP